LNSRLRGYLSIFAAAFFWGSSGTAAKYLFQHNISPMLVVQSRVIIAAVLLTALLLAVNRRLLVISPGDLKDFALLGVIGVAGSNYAYYMAIQVTSVGIAILMQYTAPVMVALYMLISRQEKISRVKSLAIALSLGGSTVMLGAFNPEVHITAAGIFLGIVSAVCFAFFNIYNKVASKHYSIWTAVTWTLICAGTFWILIDLLFGIETVPVGSFELATLTAFSLTSIIFPYYFYFTGLKRLAPSTAVIVSTLEPVVAILTSFLFLGETLGMSQIAGGIFIVSAVILLEVYRE
jgi:drug/metabolite transporter (DMT)-like permease